MSPPRAVRFESSPVVMAGPVGIEGLVEQHIGTCFVIEFTNEQDIWLLILKNSPEVIDSISSPGVRKTKNIIKHDTECVL